MTGHRILFLLALLCASSCGADARRSAVESLRSVFNPPPPPADTIPEMLDYAADLGVNLSEMAKSPEGVLYADTAPGDGPPAAEGDSVEIGYVGWLPSGTKIDSEVVALRIGSRDVMPGIDLALPGMKPGGRRKLVLPPGLAYGSDGGPGIPPNAVLVYDVTLRARIP